MKILIPGGSGQLGTILARAFHAEGHEVVVLSRSPKPTLWRTLPWDGKEPGPWCRELEGCDVLINLAGRSVNCRHHAQNRQEVLDSRTETTRVLGQAVSHAKRPPDLWLQAGTTEIYAPGYHDDCDEFSNLAPEPGPANPESWAYSAAAAGIWEHAFSCFTLPHTRRVLMRMARVMSPDRGGSFHILSSLVQTGLGGRAGDGKQFVSWIHEVDFVAAIHHLIRHRALSGIFNLSAPNPLPNQEFMRHLREAWGQRSGLSASRWMLEVGAIFMRTESALLLRSNRVVPRRLLESGFVFGYGQWDQAARELVARLKEVGGAGSQVLESVGAETR